MNKYKNFLSRGIWNLIFSPKEDEIFKNQILKDGIQIIQFEDTPTFLILTDVGKVPKILVFQDPWDFYDINLLLDSEKDYLGILYGNNKDYVLRGPEGKFPNQWAVNFLQKKNVINPIKHILKKASSLKLYAEADFIGKKVQNMFHLKEPPETLRNPIIIYDEVREKTKKPSFTWIARWDPQKRPDMMLKIARDLPDYDFYLIGTATVNSRDYLSIEKKLKDEFSKYSNIHILGFVDEKTKREYIGRSWALINTSIREGLPITFLEAMAEGTPIISYVDPDNYTSKFGIKVDYNVSSFKDAINKSVKEKLYEKIGETEREYIKKEHEISVVMKKHIDIYHDLIKMILI